MKIGVCIKQVPLRDEELNINADASWIDAPENYDSCEPENYALEAALLLREQHGGEVVAISMAPDSATEILKTAMAKGADRAVHIVDEEVHTLDPMQIAGTIAAATGDEGFDLVLTGLQSDDHGFGQTGVLLAELLGVPHSTVIVELEVEGQTLNVKRELEGGWFQRVELALPSVLTIQSGTNKPRYATFKGIIAAKKKPINTLQRDAVLPADVSATQRTLKIYIPETSKQTQMLEGSVDDQAAALLDKLRNEAGVL